MFESKKFRIVLSLIILCLVSVTIVLAYQVSVPMMTVIGGWHLGRFIGKKLDSYVEGKE